MTTHGRHLKGHRLAALVAGLAVAGLVGTGAAAPAGAGPSDGGLKGPWTPSSATRDWTGAG
ncbi:hypothetical protein [Streptomyces solincola]|uniref:hypothetical protein n=1 Tax=Streptomyces solincola TaxID=2100817 RepID=UPI002AFDE50B|nr:hypothetical protein [Streptomyces solincola]